MVVYLVARLVYEKVALLVAMSVVSMVEMTAVLLAVLRVEM